MGSSFYCLYNLSINLQLCQISKREKKYEGAHPLLVNPGEPAGLRSSATKPSRDSASQPQPSGDSGRAASAPTLLRKTVCSARPSSEPPCQILPTQLSQEEVSVFKSWEESTITSHATCRSYKSDTASPQTVLSSSPRPLAGVGWRQQSHGGGVDSLPATPAHAHTNTAVFYLTTSYCWIRGRSSVHRASLSC